jgi:Icc-related predicted phosphoesterase
MKIAYCSDLHLEFKTLELTNTENADVLVLAGDILNAQDLYKHKQPGMLPPLPWGAGQASAYRFREFLERVNSEFKNIIVIAGNHEFYSGKWVKSLKHLRDEYSNYSNIHFLERDIISINDVTFVGGSLWTDMNRFDPLTLHATRDMMQDYNMIRHDDLEYRKLKPADTAKRHKETLGYFKEVVKDKEKVVIVSHHAPSVLSVNEMYRGHFAMNGAYYSDLSEFILDNPQIKLWVHGHMHDDIDYTLGETRVVCNPRGYAGYETRANTFNLRYIEV